MKSDLEVLNDIYNDLTKLHHRIDELEKLKPSFTSIKSLYDDIGDLRIKCLYLETRLDNASIEI